MKELLIWLLESFGYPVRLQGTLAKDEKYPESFFTFWVNDSTDGSHYDNEPIDFIWDFDINFYSSDPNLVKSTLSAVRKLLRDHGFIISGKGHDVASDEPTHTGQGINALIMERQEGT